MNINKKKLLVLFLTLVLCQFQLSSLKAEDVKSIDDEELPAIDPFAGGTAGSINQSVEQSENQQNSKFVGRNPAKFLLTFPPNFLPNARITHSIQQFAQS